MRVLVVEDSVKMAAVLKRGLEEEGYAVDVAATGEDGLWMATENPNDVIVLDIVLPDMDGFEVCQRLRGGGQRAPVLMLTARDAVPDRVRGLDAGADDYLSVRSQTWKRMRAGRTAGRRPGARRLPSHNATGQRWTSCSTMSCTAVRAAAVLLGGL